MPKIGARILKTSIAVTITMFICNLLKLEPAIFGAVSAVVNVQPSVYLTIKAAKGQIIAHVLGVGAGLVLGYVFGGSPLTMGLATILVISLFVKLNLKNGLQMGIVATIFILSSSPDQFLAHALDRSAVIFIGLVIAMLINVILWPPRYGRQLTIKLRESNDTAVHYFCQAVRNFVRLENEQIPSPHTEKEKVSGLISECRVLAEHARRERYNTVNDYEYLDPNNWLPLAEKLINHNEMLMVKADRIYELLPGRLERRLKHGANPISTEFQSMLNILESGCSTVIRVNDKLKTLVCDKALVKPEEISEVYWESLTDAVDKWHDRFSGSYYLHALIEISVVASEIKWASREGKKFINMIINVNSTSLKNQINNEIN
ncbi:Aromatic acid exporter family member 1 [Desulfotomaculum arcticum]|uniref:Aromatic acid exporter family member 1 n=1 Tax=Desulfotruncus arcticus DSM 17038 TaxID=1121424 RepID=A0A1I2TGZ2_9FIRM|nr:aromatic acid exporter family protein [Desulfotruncus arcticus]SFG64165.1 Aromatic acid exporter family member 1 [Desulfotomaculum arcticum] [Desulfotruncus arcticus DSM 17038]